LPDLFATNMSLSRFLGFENLWKKIGLLLVRWPISLHASWLTAASLLNLNAWAAVSNISMGDQVAIGFFSSYFATIAGSILSYKLGDPFIALTVAWALAALSAQTKKGCQVDLPIDTIDALARTVIHIILILIIIINLYTINIIIGTNVVKWANWIIFNSLFQKIII